MTLKEKEHKIKLILLIIMVQTELGRRQVLETIPEMLAYALDMTYWKIELANVSKTPASNGSLGIVGNNNKEEIIERG